MDKILMFVLKGLRLTVPEATLEDSSIQCPVPHFSDPLKGLPTFSRRKVTALQGSRFLFQAAAMSDMCLMCSEYVSLGGIQDKF